MSLEYYTLFGISAEFIIKKTSAAVWLLYVYIRNKITPREVHAIALIVATKIQSRKYFRKENLAFGKLYILSVDVQNEVYP
jgi:hypothetical protein